MSVTVRVYVATWVSITPALKRHFSVPEGVEVQWVDCEDTSGAGEWPLALPAVEILVDGVVTAREIGALTNDELAVLVTRARQGGA